MLTAREFMYGSMLIAGVPAERVQEMQRRHNEQIAWLKAELRAEFDDATLTWLEPLVLQRWNGLLMSDG